MDIQVSPQSLADLGVSPLRDSPLASIKFPKPRDIAPEENVSLIQLEILSPSTFVSPDYNDLPQLIALANTGMKNGIKPVLADGAMGGTYFLRDEKSEFTVVCKPGDEEPNSLLNPHQVKKGTGRCFKGKIVPGFGMYREVAAFVLDDGFVGVPPTQLARVCDYFGARNGMNNITNVEYKLCSVQSYVRNECSAEDMGPGRFSKEDIQRIAVFDIRLCNLDRHEGNILVVHELKYRNDEIHMLSEDSDECESLEEVVFPMDHGDGSDNLNNNNNHNDMQYHLVPIDHGYILPHVLYMGDPSLAWMNWPQSSEPISPTVQRHIESLDYARDAELLRKSVGAALPDTSLLTLQVCTSYLKKGVTAGLTLKQLGIGMTASSDPTITHSNNNEDDDPISPLQRAVHLAIHRAVHVCGPQPLNLSYIDDSILTKRCYSADISESLGIDKPLLKHRIPSTTDGIDIRASAPKPYPSGGYGDINLSLGNSPKFSLRKTLDGRLFSGQSGSPISVAAQFDITTPRMESNKNSLQIRESKVRVTESVLRRAIQIENGLILTKEIDNVLHQLITELKSGII